MIGKRGPCGWPHGPSLSRAIGLLRPGGPIGYQARGGGPLLSTRAAAIANHCAQHHPAPAWIVESTEGELIDNDPNTGTWWTPEAARQYVDQGCAAWAYPRAEVIPSE